MKTLADFNLKMGDVIGNWTIYSPEMVIKDKRYHAQIKCKCGQISTRRVSSLITDLGSSCMKCAVKEKLAKPRKNYKSISSYYYNNLKSNAKSRNLEFCISKKDMYEVLEKQHFKCALTNLPIKLDIVLPSNKSQATYSITASLDRIDSFKGYTPENIQWVHKWVNVMKGSMSNHEFITICRIVSEANTEFRYDNPEPSFMQGYLARYKLDKHRKGATTRE